MNPADYVSGPVIDTPELLRDVILYEDAVWIAGAARECGLLRCYAGSAAILAHWLEAGAPVCRAFLKCPQTAAEMRKETTP
jgi:hypothetical protein